MGFQRVSIVICTYNRAPFLKRTLESLKRQTYNNFEIVVVNGPSTDDTAELLTSYEGKIKIRQTPFANLSISRNVGIRAATGDILAFIDDDAIPYPQWLDDICSLYDVGVGGVGGKVYKSGGREFQFTNGIINIWGEPEALRPEPGEYNDPVGDMFNILIGTNATYARAALANVGGFDEYYEYYHDESDLAVRIIKAGYKILHHPEAYVYHESAKSHIRTSDYKLNWYPIVKNTVYFALKNSEGHGSLESRKYNAEKAAKKYLNYFASWREQGIIDEKEHAEFVEMWNRGFVQAMSDGVNNERRIASNLIPDSEFLPYRSSNAGENLNICLLSQDFPPEEVGGVAKYTWQLAKGYRDAGHNVHIITRGNEFQSWMQEGVTFHSIFEQQIPGIGDLEKYPISKKNVDYSYAIYKRIQELNPQYGFDIIESPTWDAEGVITARLSNIPVVTRLQSPMLKVAETQQWKISEDMRLAADFEKSLFELSDGIISISHNILETISELYDNPFKDNVVESIYLGIENDDECTNFETNNNGNMVDILFVGRLERRKGIHLLLEVVPTLLAEYTNIRFVFVGDDTIPNEKGVPYKEDFLTINSGNVHLDRVIFKGKIETSQLVEEYRNCDIFVAPSLYESFGIILIEAMRVGKAVIGSKVGGMQEIVVDGETGFLIEPENRTELYNRLKQLIDSREIRESFGRNGYERMQRLFSQKQMIDNSLAFYQSVMAKKQKGFV